MTHQFTVSDLGFRLIKAYEGFRAESRILISGQSVVGYGHRMSDQDAVALTPEEAENLLREDIQPVESLVNEAIFAPLTQGQFDALCSLAYNIGPDAFKKSDIVKAINNGRPIDAANGFDVWRKGEVDGQTFVIDALVRRRTAEKALFLKPERRLTTSPRDTLPPEKDYDLARQIATRAPLYDLDNANGYVQAIPYNQQPNPGRRREDGPAGGLELSEFVVDDGPSISKVPLVGPSVDVDDVPHTDQSVTIEDNQVTITDEPLVLSSIAEAAAEVSNRLDALIDDHIGEETDISDMPNSLIDAPLPETVTSKKPGIILPFRGKKVTKSPLNDGKTAEGSERFDDQVNEENMSRSKRSVAESAIKAEVLVADKDDMERQSNVPFIIMLVSGLIMVALSMYAWMKGPVELMGTWGPIATLVGLIMGGVIILGSIYYIMKSSFLGR
ncbi:MAG: lysozyme [Maricaulaceae bacterium]